MGPIGTGQICKVMGPPVPSGKQTTSTLGASSKTGSWEREGFKVEDCGDMEEFKILLMQIQCGMGS